MKKFNLFLKNFSDERINIQKYKYSHETLIIVLTLLFIDFMYKIYINDSNYITSAIIFIISILYLTIRYIYGGVILSSSRLKVSSKNKTSIHFIAFKRASLGTLVIIIIDLISKKTPSKLIFSALFWFISFYVMILILHKVGSLTDNRNIK